MAADGSAAGAVAVARRERTDPPARGVLKPSRLIAWPRAIGIILWTLWLTLVNLRTALSKRGMPASVTMKWHRTVLKLAGIELTVTGTPVRDRPVLVAANHSSYLDIVALGALLPCSFVSKAEVKDWPGFGWLAVQQRTVFIERNPRQAARHLEEMKEHLRTGDCLVVFPEGTSSDGTRVLPFKSTLFQAASIELPESGQIAVQPVSIAYTRLDGMPMGRAFRPFFTWFGDMDLAPHLIAWLGLGTLGIDVVFHHPLTLDETDGRKDLARRCQDAVARGLEGALTGRPGAEDPRADAAAEGRLA
jgi:1-acyl-sn-glycerol-3-phosphate acyltransferase